jgi:hypothetical protein
MNLKNYARGRTAPGILNKLETKFSLHLEQQKADGTILWWAYEAIRLRLAKNTTYTPDFFIMTKDLELQVWEVKGRWLAEARTKIKVASDIYPFRFFGVMWKDKQWKVEEF